MKRPNNELVREAVKAVTAHGFVPIVRNGGKHVKLSWTSGGRRHVLVISRSPSSQRARMKSRAVLRRLLNGNGGA
jgi:hypothetical protein